MSVIRSSLFVLLSLAVLLSTGCSHFYGREPVDVMVVGIEPLQGEGMELRMLVKLRIQNPSDTPIDFSGVSMQMDVQDKLFATGVSNATGSVPRFGETIIKVPMSVSTFGIMQQAFNIMAGGNSPKLAYELTGKLARPASFDSVGFTSQGDLTLPAGFFEGGK